MPEPRKWQIDAAVRQDRKEQKITFIQQASWLILPGKTAVYILGIHAEAGKAKSR